MKNLVPEIFRQRLLIEGLYTIEVDEAVIHNYFKNLTEILNLKMYREPIIFSPGSLGKQDNQGFDAFVPLIDSGISLYVWSNQKFLSVVIYTCKGFDETLAIDTTKSFFKLAAIEFQSF
jgi:hypothetical protein